MSISLRSYQLWRSEGYQYDLQSEIYYRSDRTLCKGQIRVIRCLSCFWVSVRKFLSVVGSYDILVVIFRVICDFTKNKNQSINIYKTLPLLSEWLTDRQPTAGTTGSRKLIFGMYICWGCRIPLRGFLEIPSLSGEKGKLTWETNSKKDKKIADKVQIM